jgi:hypothetical protein
MVNNPAASCRAGVDAEPGIRTQWRACRALRARLFAGLGIALMAAGWVIGVPTSAHAGPSDIEKHRATEWMDKGNERLGQGSYAQALDAFKQADAVMSVPVTRVAVAQALERLGRLIEAREAAVEATRMPQDPDEPEPFALARVQAAKLVVDLEVRIPMLVVVINGPAGVTAHVRIDGAELANNRLGFPQRVNPGTHSVTASAAGCEPVTEAVRIQEGENKRVSLGLRATSGLLPATTSQPAGTSALVYVGFAVGATGLTVGAVTGILSMSRAADLRQKCGGNDCPPEFQSDMTQAKNLGWASNISIGVGLAGIGVGTLALLMSSGQRERPAKPVATHGVRIGATLGPGHLGLHGDF